MRSLLNLLQKAQKYSACLVGLTMLFVVLSGAAMTFLPIRPFWVDEWRVIYNIKFKSYHELWGQLDFMQQYPRVYLTAVKYLGERFVYSYQSLRLPAYIAGLCMMAMSNHVRKILFPDRSWLSFFFIVLPVATLVFTEYFVETKQYTMDMLFSYVAVWQFIRMRRIQQGERVTLKHLALLVSGFTAGPFLSYTYPIAAAPVFFYGGYYLLQILNVRRRNLRIITVTSLLMVTGGISIIGFYFVDGRQLLGDKGMHGFWSFMMMNGTFSSFAVGVFRLPASLGSGDLFTILFGVVGLLAIGFASVWIVRGKLTNGVECDAVWYSLMVVCVTVGLFMLKKIPLGVSRLNAFAIPALSILLIVFLQQMGQRWKWVYVLAALLLAGAMGNVFSTTINYFISPSYKKQMAIYRATANATLEAQRKRLPILVTPGVTWPYEWESNAPFCVPITGEWVLQTWPQYDMQQRLPVVAVKTVAEGEKYFDTSGLDSVMVGDGMTFRKLYRNKLRAE